MAICWMWGAGAALACPCDPISPEAGFDRAQYGFTGKVVQAENHAWLIEVERVWKGHEKLARTVKLMDVYATLDCEFFFQPGQRYVFFAILAKGGREVFYHPQACNWTRPLQSTRVPAEGNEQLWLEDLITREHGPGEQPRAERPLKVNVVEGTSLICERQHKDHRRAAADQAFQSANLRRPAVFRYVLA